MFEVSPSKGQIAMRQTDFSHTEFQPNFLTRDSAFQASTEARGESIFKGQDAEGPSLFSRDYWYGQIMDWSMRNEAFKTQMFRFVDVLPYLHSGSEVARHLKEYFAEGGEELPKVFNFGVGLGSLAPGLMAGAIRKNVVQMAKMFIAGEDAKEALSVLKKARKQQIGFTADLLGEACLSEAEAQDYIQRYRDLIEWLADSSQSWDHVPLIDSDHLGPIPKVNVSVKLSSLDAAIDLKSWDETKARLKDRLRPLMTLAASRGVFLNFDMEQYELKELTLEVFTELLLEPEFKSYPHFGCVIQAYLRDSQRDVQRLIEFAKERSTPFTIRLVKGAYWDFETIHARQMGWPVPVFTNKKESDANFEACAEWMLKAHPFIRLAIGSHNIRSIASILVSAERHGIDPRALEVQMLYGMADGFKRSLVKQGIRVREYAPIGELIPGMAYLVRRLLENTSNESFLRSKFVENVDTKFLLQDPAVGVIRSSGDPKDLEKTKPYFRNLPLIDFGIAQNRAKMKKAIDAVRSEIGRDWPSRVGGQNIETNDYIVSVNPSRPSEVIGRAHACSPKEALAALERAHEAFSDWSQTSPFKRAGLLDALADLIESDRFRWSALEVLEAGKPWEEADADIAEAVDFLRYYAQEMRRLAPGFKVGSAPGEESRYRYRARGVVAVIAPWNFPLAILTGMAAGAVVTGNTVVMKPAEQTPVIASWLMRAMETVGFPKNVIQLVHGRGEDIGDTLTGSGLTAMVAFTGSQPVGLHILQQIAQPTPGSRTLKRAMIELGGKNAIIIDSDADLDEAIGGVLYSAFGFAGQKCSAASRVIVLDEIYDRFVSRLSETVKLWKVLDAENPAADLGPVIDQDAFDRIQSLIQEAKSSDASLLFQGDLPKGSDENGFFIAPHIFTNVDPKSRLAQEEVFGPVLAVMRVKSFEDALAIANDVDYGLTAGLYSRSPARIDQFKNEIEVGNAYINRPCTGAMVDRHPFGGFKLSGLGSKTGGPDYLLQFVDPMVVTENTLRRGFAPEES